MAKNTASSITIADRSIEAAVVMVVVIGASGGAEVEKCVKCQWMTMDAPSDAFRLNTNCTNFWGHFKLGGFFIASTASHLHLYTIPCATPCG